MAEHVDIGAAVRSAREAQGLSLRHVAGRLEVSPATLSALERGLTPISLERLHALSDLLEVPASRLLAGERTMAPSAVQAPGDRDWRDFSDIHLGTVLEGAARVFVRRGFHAAGMREVAAEAGLSVAGVYHHFPSKQHILAALLDLTMAEIGWRIAAARDEGEGPSESFALMVEALALFHAVRGDLAFLGASEMRGLEGGDRARVVALRDEVQYAIDRQAEVCLDAGVFACADPRTASRAITSMCTALPGWFNVGGAMSPQVVAKRYGDYALAIMQARRS